MKYYKCSKRSMHEYCDTAVAMVILYLSDWWIPYSLSTGDTSVCCICVSSSCNLALVLVQSAPFYTHEERMKHWHKLNIKQGAFYKSFLGLTNPSHHLHTDTHMRACTHLSAVCRCSQVHVCLYFLLLNVYMWNTECDYLCSLVGAK